MVKINNSRVPSGKFSRLLSLGSMTAGIAGNVFYSASKKIISGERPQLKNLILTQSNAIRFSRQLLRMRGAALKIGQLISLESGDFLHPELSAILSDLRNNAQSMPIEQVKEVLVSSWGKNYLKHFETFEEIPMAAASIGQVHKCKLKDGRVLAVKIQYPGIKESIDSDMDSLGFLLKKSGVVPYSFNVAELISAAREQLHKETSYISEAGFLKSFSQLLLNDKNFSVPKVEKNYTTDKTLAMEFKAGVTIDKITSAEQITKDRVIHNIFDLFFRELFQFYMIQTDPNYANFLFNEKTGKIILLDFGATVSISPEISFKFKKLLLETMRSNRKESEEALADLGIVDKNLPKPLVKKLVDLYWEEMKPLREGRTVDFARSDIVEQITDLSGELILLKNKIQIPQIEVLSIQRKVGGLFLLARRFKSKIDVTGIINKYIK